MHLSMEDLRAWRDGRDDGRDRIIAHLAECDACGARLAELMRTAPVDQAASSFDAESFRAAGHRAGEWRAASRRPAWRYVPVFAAAAAILVAIVYVTPSLRDTGSALRGGTALKLVQPSGPVARADLVFAWEGPEGRYRLRVFDLEAPDAPVIARDDVASGYQPTSDERAKLRAGVSYRWFVERPETGVASPAGRFTVR